jgi:curli biogenesis system outer membrane secretion channel CsgG
MRWILLIFFSFATLFAEVYTKNDVRVYEGVGQGFSRKEAVNNALAEAMEQINGVTINKEVLSEDIVVDSDKDSNSAFIFDSKIKKISHGRVDSYKIKSVKKDESGRYEAVVEIVKKKTSYAYKSPGLNPKNRRALAVIPFEYKPKYNLYGASIDGRALSLRLTQSVVNKITQTRKFSVLDRQNSKYYELEKRFLTSGNSEPSELARLGRRLGVDYFIIGQILDFAMAGESKTNYYTSETKSKNHAFITLSYRILNVPTQQIKFSDTIDIDFELGEAKRAESMILKASNRVAQVLVEQILNSIYPPKVVDVSGERLIINMGGSVIKEGEVYTLFALGKKLIDPYIKEYLARDEIEIGKIEITKVKPKISYAKLLLGKAKVGAILRKEKTKSKIETNSHEGRGYLFDKSLFSNP